MLQVNENLRIRKVDDRCLVLEKRSPVSKKKTGEQKMEWQFCGYYGTLEQALSGAVKKALFDSVDVANKIEGLLNEIEKIKQEIFAEVKKFKADTL